MLTDSELLRRYAEEGSEPAFAALVERHINVVYRTALRRVGGDAHAADDVTQRVFTDLARKAGQLRDHPSLAGWLHTGTRFAAAELVRSEQRRRTHEQEALAMQESETTPPSSGIPLDPVLDEILDLLEERDRDAILLHYFEGQTFAEVGAALRLSADAARMRVNRAMERLRTELVRRGVASTAAALATSLSAQSTVSVPATLAGTVSVQAIGQAGPSIAAGAAGVSGALIRRLALGLSAGLIAVLTVLNYRRPQDPAPVPPGVAVTRVLPPPAAVGPNSEAVPLAAVETVLDTSLAPPETGAVPAAVSLTGLRFGDLTGEEKGILKELWALQEQVAPAAVPGFSVSQNGPNYTAFATGRDRLIERGLAKANANGVVFLRTAGRTFAEQHKEELAALPFFYAPPGQGLVRNPGGVPFETLTVREKNILKRLLVLETEKGVQPGVATTVRYGFVISQENPGLQALLLKGWVSIGAQKGAVYLTPAGRNYGELNREAFDNYQLTLVDPATE